MEQALARELQRPDWRQRTGERARPRLGTSAAFGKAELWLLAAIFLCGLGLRFYRLDSAGLADDEVHKWLAALRYLKGDFGGDDLEHPMLLKSLVALGLRLFPGLPLETLTHWPSALAGALTVPALALLGKRLFGRSTGLLAAALLAVSSVAVGYHRVAKEDALFGLFLVLHLWGLAEAVAAADERRKIDQGRWEIISAAAMGAMLASKYFVFLAPAGLIAVAWLKPVSLYRLPLKRLLLLGLVAAAVFAALDWVLFIPTGWDYLRTYAKGERVSTPSMIFDGRVYLNLPFAPIQGVPARFWGLFALGKLTPPVFAAACAGLGFSLWRRRPGERVLLSWLLIWAAIFLPSGAKYARYAVSIMPAVALLAASAVVDLGRIGLLLGRWRPAPGGRLFRRGPAQGAALRDPAAPFKALVPAFAAALAVLAVSAELQASLSVAPYYRHYISPLAGGEARLLQLFPHCDLWDEGVREATLRIAHEAGPGDVIASEVGWPVRLYLEQAGRTDVLPNGLRRGEACAGPGACWVLAQPGRVYLHNQEALANLKDRRPAFTIDTGGVETVRVWRLEPGVSPWDLSPQARAAGGAPVAAP